MNPNPRIAFIGAGNMASAMIGGLIQSGIAACHLSAADPYAPGLEQAQQRFGIQTSTDNNAIIANADVVILAVKPQQLKAVCADIRDTVMRQQPLLISIAAGIRSDALAQWLSPSLAIVRCMPNTPALIGKAASGLYANANVSAAQQQLAAQLLSAIGTVDWVAEENLLDAVTAVSGSGPAYFFLVMEAMIEAGVALGLERDVARNLTLQTALGAATMAMQADVDVDELRRRVTSPGGTTQAAVTCFEEGNIRQLFSDALLAADQRSKSLAQELQ